MNEDHLDKPVDLIYGLEDNPPWGDVLLLALQHMLIIAGGLVYPVMIVTAAGGSAQQAHCLVSLTMVSWGLGTILMAMRKRGLGSGYLCPKAESEAYLAASILAVKTGGLSLFLGMSMIGGLFEGLMSKIVQRMRALFPPEVSGVVVLMIGISIIPVAISSLLGSADTIDSMHKRDILIAMATLAVMVGTNVWSKGNLREYCIFLGILVGYVLAAATGCFNESHWLQIKQASWLAWPHMSFTGWSFDSVLLLPFIIAALASALKCMGDITTAQKINDPKWKRPDMESISGGLMADSLSVIAGGLIGGFPQATSSANVGLSLATGATSRRIAFVTGAILILLAFLPKLSIFFAIMPQPVAGASLIFCVCFILVAGFQIVLSRMIDSSKTFVIGMSLIIGLSVDLVPGLYNHTASWLQPVVSSSLSLGTVSVVILNLVLRIGIAKHQIIVLTPDSHKYQEIAEFMETQGGAWGARREIVYRAVGAMNEFMESAASLELSRGNIEMDVSFDEYNLDVDINYQGILMEFPRVRPSEEDLLNDETALVSLSGYMMRRYADRVKSELKDGRCHIRFHFDH